MGKQVSWTREQKGQAAIHYAINGNLSKLFRDQGIPISTSSTWKHDTDWLDTVVTIRKENTEEHRAKYAQIVGAAQDVVLAKVGDASAAQANLIACQATDKVRLHDGMPTSISSQDNRALAEVCKELSRTMRDHRVVSTQ